MSDPALPKVYAQALGTTGPRKIPAIYNQGIAYQQGNPVGEASII